MAWPWTRTTPPGADVQSNATLFSKNLKIRIVDLHNFWKRDYNLTKRDAFNTVKHWLYISIIFLRCDPQTKKYQVGFLEISLKKALIRLLLLYHKRDHDTMHTNLPGADVQDQSHTRHFQKCWCTGLKIAYGARACIHTFSQAVRGRGENSSIPDVKHWRGCVINENSLPTTHIVHAYSCWSHGPSSNVLR